MGYSKAPEQPQSSARPICHSHTMTNTGLEPATIRIAAYRSSPRYALGHGEQGVSNDSTGGQCITSTEFSNAASNGLILAMLWY